MIDGCSQMRIITVTMRTPYANSGGTDPLGLVPVRIGEGLCIRAVKLILKDAQKRLLVKTGSQQSWDPAIRLTPLFDRPENHRCHFPEQTHPASLHGRASRCGWHEFLPDDV